LLDKIGKAAANGSVPHSGAASKGESVTGQSSAMNVSSTGGAAAALSSDDKVADDKLARDFLSLSKEVTQALKNKGFLSDINGESLPSSGSGLAHSSHNLHEQSAGGCTTGENSDNGLSDPGLSGMQGEAKK